MSYAELLCMLMAPRASKASLDVRSHCEFMSLHRCEKQPREVGGCFWKVCTSTRSWKGFPPTACSCCFCSISEWPPSILNLCQWPFCSAEGSYQDGDFGWWCLWGGGYPCVDIKLVTVTQRSSLDGLCCLFPHLSIDPYSLRAVWHHFNDLCLWLMH